MAVRDLNCFSSSCLRFGPIPGIGPKRKQELLKQFKSLTAIGQATLPELERILPRDAAAAVYHHFHNNGED